MSAQPASAAARSRVVRVRVHRADRVGQPDHDLLDALARAIAARRRSRSGRWRGRRSACAGSRCGPRGGTERAITSSSAGTHEMKRIPVVIILQRRVRHRLADQADALERVLPVEAHRDRQMGARGEVERVEPDAVHRGRDREHVGRRQAGRSPQALVAVARARVDELDAASSSDRRARASRGDRPARNRGAPSTLISSARLVSTPSTSTSSSASSNDVDRCLAVGPWPISFASSES